MNSGPEGQFIVDALPDAGLRTIENEPPLLLTEDGLALLTESEQPVLVLDRNLKYVTETV